MPCYHREHKRELTCKRVLLEFPQNFTDKWAYNKLEWQVPFEDAKVCSIEETCTNLQAAEFYDVDNDFFFGTVYT